MNIVSSKVLIGGKVIDWNGAVEDVTSPILDASTNERIVIGRMAQIDENEAMQVAEVAKAAWNNGRGEWPQMTLQNRIKAIENLVVHLKERRDSIVQILMWEICKNAADAAAEFDRTIQFIEATIKAVHELDRTEGAYQLVSGIRARVRRAAIGILLALGPFNYPVSNISKIEFIE